MSTPSGYMIHGMFDGACTRARVHTNVAMLDSKVVRK